MRSEIFVSREDISVKDESLQVEKSFWNRLESA